MSQQFTAATLSTLQCLRATQPQDPKSLANCHAPAGTASRLAHTDEEEDAVHLTRQINFATAARMVDVQSSVDDAQSAWLDNHPTGTQAEMQVDFKKMHDDVLAKAEQSVAKKEACIKEFEAMLHAGHMQEAPACQAYISTAKE